MGLMNDLKKIFFGAKAVSKSAADKAVDKAASQGKKMTSAADNMLDNARDKASDVGGDLYNSASDLFETAKDKAGDLYEKAKSKAEDFSERMEEDERVEKARGFTEDVGSKVLDTGEDFMDRAKRATERIGEEVMDKGEDFFDKAQDFASEKGGVFKSKMDDLAKLAQEEADKQKIEDSLSEVDKMERDLARRVKERDQKGVFGDDSSLLDGKDDFFERAARFAEGDYHGKGMGSDGKMDANSFPEVNAENDDILDLLPMESEDSSKDKVPFKGDVKGFVDADGDGDPVIDDAVIVEDEDTDIKLLDDGMDEEESSKKDQDTKDKA